MQLNTGMVHLDEAQSRHVRDVMRLRAGDVVELFDATGKSANARIVATSPGVQLLVEELSEAVHRPMSLTIGAATPKGARADWMVEKLSELDVAKLVLLESDRTVVHPESGKLARWERIASESAKQCRRSDVMKIVPPMGAAQFCASAAGEKWCLSTEGPTTSVRDRLLALSMGALSAVIGPEGGWTPRELATFGESGFKTVALTSTILRIETAAIAVASSVMAWAALGKEQEK